VVPIDNARRIFDAAEHPKSFVSLDGADHLLLARREDATFVAEIVSAWARRQIEPEMNVERSADASDESRRVVVTSAESGYANRVAVRGHQWMADEPEALGGTDTGPTPYEFLLAGLGGCKSITMRMYAERKGWPLERIRVGLKHQKIRAKDCLECETETGKIDRIEAEIDLQGPLSDSQIERLRRVADRCPVHRTLSGEIDIRNRPASEI
jgi:putative redox protein